MRRALVPPLAAALLVVGLATAAFGHASFREREVPAETEQTLVLRVPEERPGEGTVAVETLVPDGFEIVDCPSEDPWTCRIEDADDGVVLSWSRETGGEDAELSIVVRTPATTGEHRWPTIQTYDSGTEVAWAQRAGEDRPAPTLTVAEPGAPVVEDTGDPADHGEEVTGTPVAPDESVPPTEPAETEFTPPVSPAGTAAPADPGASVSAAPIGEEDDGGVPVLAIVLILGILAAAIGALRMTRRGPAGGDPGGATSDPYDPEV